MNTFTDIKGVYANGIECGIKKNKKDLAYIYVPDAKASAGVFTRNKCAASSVSYTQAIMKKNTIKAVVVNSGNANCYTGTQGEKDTKAMSRKAAALLNLRPSEVAVASTGIIGKTLPMDVIEKGLESLLLNPELKESDAAADAILTVDCVKKMVYKSAKIGKKEIIVSGISKG